MTLHVLIGVVPRDFLVPLDEVSFFLRLQMYTLKASYVMPVCTVYPVTKDLPFFHTVGQ